MIILDISTNLISLGISFIIFLFLLIAYKNYNYPSFKYILASNFLFLINAIIAMVNIYFQEMPLSLDVLITSFEFITVVWGLYLNLQFFRTFWFETLITKSNLILGILIILFSTGTTLITMVLVAFEDRFFSGISTFAELISSVETYPNEIKMIASLLGFFTLVGLVIIFVCLFTVEVQLRNQIKITKDNNVKQILKRMRMGNWGLLAGAALIAINETIGFVLLTIGYALTYYFYLRGGLFILQEETLRRLIIMDSNGILKYSYEFRKFTSKERRGDEDSDILFSGALKAVSSLLGELTGANQELREIHLDKMSLLVGKTSENKLSMVLLVDRPTTFFREAFNEVLNELHSKIGDFEPDAIFDGKISKNLDTLVQRRFGLEK